MNSAFQCWSGPGRKPNRRGRHRESQAIATDAYAPRSPPINSNTLRILVVEDNLTNQFVIRQAA